MNAETKIAPGREMLPPEVVNLIDVVLEDMWARVLDDFARYAERPEDRMVQALVELDRWLNGHEKGADDFFKEELVQPF